MIHKQLGKQRFEILQQYARPYVASKFNDVCAYLNDGSRIV
jgi:hypothetical protein